jgi:hypothetical protein
MKQVLETGRRVTVRHRPVEVVSQTRPDPRENVK